LFKFHLVSYILINTTTSRIILIIVKNANFCTENLPPIISLKGKRKLKNSSAVIAPFEIWLAVKKEITQKTSVKIIASAIL